MGFYGDSDGKESSCNVGDLGLTPGLGRSPGEVTGIPTPIFLPEEFHGHMYMYVCVYWGRKWQPTPVFLTGKFHEQRSLAGHSPWNHRVEHD